ncbi:DUF1684 domain-containing protein [Haloferax mediterranei ATCC 33500]|uniref:DUF1684 domain-containing protein n=1 Tax=Haloferax mediterranei (strain ATCC 33500 / DSM 1411 / JCM 8866 / NBRC 14739 / NCIMB 2177 / R-4) TaxID=523841 RepID=I3R3E7_HALMT|nr:DUF1684 domain-containing protein [Haloferax mediterranei]AFK18757.1 hypothetical protein HFX_1041 [Haloferax mediterranei ATCC 33500]AHZ21875.1 hypothetical protein BM92_04005 [Haloferax mediterranei ATCC 33500]EMA03383.1 hypothetical protein C439_05275 [Haloferax mediterranei ATCC 33500]MDX5988853.1 DUF1684 domain-containing protein [Haloferax mediterranei ATCC 33500]QCQ75252.1 DUF1684 domain-containing protein [Haloferax mediterranei ATCC 33500]
MTHDASWLSELRKHREQKDRFLATDTHSPIPADQREHFDGLDYFDPDSNLRYELELQEYDDPETITIGTSTDGEREYLVWGRFAFELDGETYALDAYRSTPDEDRLWVPFRDETNTNETYGAGRYLDLEASDRTDDGRWVLDFNYAYNPFCAYSPRYECPLVPMENWLQVRIEAGEMNYEGPGGSEGGHSAQGHGHAD